MRDARYLGVGVLVTMLVTLPASSARAVPSYDAWFSGAVSTDWNEPNNWEAQQGPNLNRTAVIGIIGLYEDVTCEILTGTNAVCNGLEIGRYANATVTIEAGASLYADDSDIWVSYTGGDAYTNTLNVYGSLTADSGTGMHVAGKANGNLTVGAGRSITLTNGGLNIGMEYHMGGTDAPYGYAYNVDHTGLITVGAAGRGYYITGDSGVSAHYQLNGSTINALGENPFTGFGYWHMGGTVEVTGDSVLNATSPAIMAGGNLDAPPASLWTTPVVKFSGTDTSLTVNGNVYCRWLDKNTMLTDPNSDPAQLDVSNLKMTDPNSWLTIINATSITDGGELAFVAGTDPNWLLQVVGNLVQVKGGPQPPDPGPIIGDIDGDGYVDDNDLSYVLAYWHKPWPFMLPDWVGMGRLMDDAVLSLVLANWHAGIPPMGGEAVPEPATITVLLLGALASVCRKRK